MIDTTAIYNLVKFDSYPDRTLLTKEILFLGKRDVSLLDAPFFQQVKRILVNHQYLLKRKGAVTYINSVFAKWTESDLTETNMRRLGNNLTCFPTHSQLSEQEAFKQGCELITQLQNRKADTPLDMSVHTPATLSKAVADGDFAQYPDHYLEKEVSK